jgi:hypothetical protein
VKGGALAMLMAVAAALGNQQIVPQVPGQDLPRALPPMKLRGDFPGIALGGGRMDRGAASLNEAPPWSAARMNGVVADPAVTALVRDLGATDFAQRDAATTALRDAKVPDEQIWIHLLSTPGGLSYEAHARLLDIGYTRIKDAPRGALGIQMAGGRMGENNGVTVTALIPNMPAQKVLRPGDRIVELDGKPIQVSEQLSTIVQTKRPGERIALVVMRGQRDAAGRVVGGPDGRPVETRHELEIEVGSRADLEKFGDGGMDAPVFDRGRDRMSELLLETFPAPVRMIRMERVPGELIAVDSHPDIIQLQAQLARPDGLGLGAGVRSVLRARLDSLEASARAPGLTDNERAWFQAVVERYRELIPEELRPESTSVPQSKSVR